MYMRGGNVPISNAGKVGRSHIGDMSAVAAWRVMVLARQLGIAIADAVRNPAIAGGATQLQ